MPSLQHGNRAAYDFNHFGPRRPLPLRGFRRVPILSSVVAFGTFGALSRLFRAEWTIVGETEESGDRGREPSLSFQTYPDLSTRPGKITNFAIFRVAGGSRSQPEDWTDSPGGNRHDLADVEAPRTSFSVSHFGRRASANPVVTFRKTCPGPRGGPDLPAAMGCPSGNDIQRLAQNDRRGPGSARQTGLSQRRMESIIAGQRLPLRHRRAAIATGDGAQMHGPSAPRADPKAGLDLVGDGFHNHI